MQTLLQIIGYGFLFFVMILFYYGFCKHHNNKQFQRFMKPGDGCFYYEGENRLRCVIQYIISDRAVIVNEWGEVKEVKKYDLYV